MKKLLKQIKLTCQVFRNDGVLMKFNRGGKKAVKTIKIVNLIDELKGSVFDRCNCEPSCKFDLGHNCNPQFCLCEKHFNIKEARIRCHGDSDVCKHPPKRE